MKSRFRVEIYDANKAHDLTLFFEQGVDKEYLTELVYSNLRRFQGNVKAYVYDTQKKKKTTAMFLPMEIVSKFQPTQLTAKELGLV